MIKNLEWENINTKKLIEVSQMKQEVQIIKKSIKIYQKQKGKKKKNI